jgi:hypothetical protein
MTSRVDVEQLKDDDNQHEGLPTRDVGEIVVPHAFHIVDRLVRHNAGAAAPVRPRMQPTSACCLSQCRGGLQTAGVPPLALIIRLVRPSCPGHLPCYDSQLGGGLSQQDLFEIREILSSLTMRRYAIRSNPRVASRTSRPPWYRAMAWRVVIESIAPFSICRFKVRIIAL